MPAFDITIENKTYHVDIPWLSAQWLPLIVNGQPFQIRLSGEAQPAPEMRVAAPTVVMPAPETRDTSGPLHGADHKPVMAEWHSSLYPE